MTDRGTATYILSVSICDRFRGKMPPRGAEAEQGEAGELTDAPQFWPEREGGCISDSVQLCEREEAHWGPPGEGAQQRRLLSPHGRLGAGHGRRLTPSRRG